MKSMKDTIKKLKRGDSAAKRLAKKLLFDAGITTKKGNLTKHYWGGLDNGQKCPVRKNAKDKKNRK